MLGHPEKEEAPSRLREFAIFWILDTYDYIAHADLSVNGEKACTGISFFWWPTTTGGPYTTVNRYRANVH